LASLTKCRCHCQLNGLHTHWFHWEHQECCHEEERER
jgi:hypothetical protein